MNLLTLVQPDFDARRWDVPSSTIMHTKFKGQEGPPHPRSPRLRPSASFPFDFDARKRNDPSLKFLARRRKRPLLHLDYDLVHLIPMSGRRQ